MRGTKSLFVGVLLAVFGLASIVWADPIGTGNYRRREAFKAAFGKKMPGKYSRWSQSCYAMGIDTVTYHSVKGHSVRRKLPADARILAVANGQTGEVALVKAPVDKSRPVRVLTTREANSYGLITQTQAAREARKNLGQHGSRGRVKVKPNGLAPFGFSYAFKQTSDLKTRTGYGDRQHLVSVGRRVPITGQPGETAVVDSWGQVGSRIKYARTAEGVTQKELARKVGVSVSTVSQWERNLKPVPQAKLPAVLRVLGDSM